MYTGKNCVVVCKKLFNNKQIRSLKSNKKIFLNEFNFVFEAQTFVKKQNCCNFSFLYF